MTNSNQQEIKQKEDLLQQFSEQTEESLSPQEKLAQEITELENRYASIKKLDEASARLKQEIAKFGALATDPNRVQKVVTLKTTRFSRIFSALKDFGKLLHKSVKSLDSASESEHGGISGLYNILFMILCILITAGVFVATRKSEIVYLGALFLVWFIFLFILSNFAGSSINQALYSKSHAKALEDLNFEDLTAKLRNAPEDSFLVNAAWVDALGKEFFMIQKGMDSLLQHKTVDEFVNSINAKKDQLHQLQHILKENDGVINTSKLQKEIDILKLEEDLALTL